MVVTRYGWRTREDGVIVTWDLPNGAERVSTLNPDLARGMDAVEARWGDLCRKHGSANGLPDGVLQAHIWRESGGNPRAFRQERHADGTPIVSPNGRPLTGVGLGQLTSPSLKGNHTDEELFDPDLNLAISAAYLGSLWRKYGGDFPRAAAAYNAGSVRPSDANPWNMVQTAGHVSSEVAAYNYWLLRSVEGAARVAIENLIPLVEMARETDDAARRDPEGSA